MLIRVNQYCFFNKRKIGSKYRIFKFFGVKEKSYAGKTLLRLYMQYFGDSELLRQTYRKYYKKEFSSYKDFLVCRYNLSDKLAEEIMKENMSCTNLSFKQDDIAYSFDADEELKKLFVEYVGGIRYED